MRASGSHSVTFDGVRLPREAVSGGFPAGNAVPYMERNLSAGLFHASSSLGIAEGAAKAALAGVAKRGATDGRTRALAAENAMDLTLARASLDRGAALIDEHEAANPGTAAIRATSRRCSSRRRRSRRSSARRPGASWSARWP